MSAEVLFKDPKTKETFLIDKKLFTAINHSNELARKSTKNDLKKKISHLLNAQSLEELKTSLELFLRENTHGKNRIIKKS
jgi:hypothetical protein